MKEATPAKHHVSTCAKNFRHKREVLVQKKTAIVMIKHLTDRIEVEAAFKGITKLDE